MDQDVIKSWVKIDEKSKHEFIDACYRAYINPMCFGQFRRQPDISMVIENSTQIKMMQTLRYLEQYGKNLVKRQYLIHYETSELYGGPVMYPYITKNRRTPFYLSPTTVRYIVTVHYLYKLVGLYREGMRIVEIGGGYGGLCKIIHDVIKPASYIVYDLPQVYSLQRQYLKSFNINVEYRHPGQPIDRADLVISWCAWSELDSEAKKMYLDTVMMKSIRGFIGCNYDCKENEELLTTVKPMTRLYEDELNYPILYY